MTSRLLNFVARLSGGVRCPKCRTKQPAPKKASVVECSRCQYVFSIHEALTIDDNSSPPAPVDPDRPPTGTKITRLTPAPGIIGWQIPRSGRAGGLLLFATAWLGFITIFTVITLIAEPDDSSSNLFMTLFTIPFWAVGFGMLYAGIRAKYSSVSIAVEADSVLMARVLFNRTSRRTLSRKTLTSVDTQVFYTQNYQPVYGIEIRGPDGKIRFGTMLSEEEKHWLVADIKRTIWPELETEILKHPTCRLNRDPNPPAPSRLNFRPLP